MSNTTSNSAAKTATVVEVRESLVLIEVDEKTPIMKNEVGYVCVGNERLKAEVLRIRGRTADMQVFEDTSGVRVGDRVEMTGEMLSATLGPGLLGHVFDGLQNPLAVLAKDMASSCPGASLCRRWIWSGSGISRRRSPWAREWLPVASWASSPRGRSAIRFSCRSANRNRSPSLGSAREI